LAGIQWRRSGAGFSRKTQDRCFHQTVVIQTDKAKEPQAGRTLFCAHTFAEEEIGESLIMRVLDFEKGRQPAIAQDKDLEDCAALD
jgi:hypothetical protein